MSITETIYRSLVNECGATFEVDGDVVKAIIASDLEPLQRRTQVKYFEIRDSGTCISAMGIKPLAANDAENFLISRSGYGDNPDSQQRYVLLVDMSEPPGTINYDHFEWSNRTMKVAHEYIIEHWHELESGAVVDVQFILDETKEPKKSERKTK